jgi:hypothetical protein
MPNPETSGKENTRKLFLKFFKKKECDMPLEILFKFRAKSIVPTSERFSSAWFFSCCARDEALTVSGSHFYLSFE